MRRALLGVLCLCAVGYGWIVLSSLFYLQFTGQSDKFSFPFVQWLQVVPYWHVSWWMTVVVFASTVLPTTGALMFLALGWKALRSRRSTFAPGAAAMATRRGVSDNHGHAAWASRGELLRRFAGPGCLIGATDRGGPLLFDDVSRGPTHSLIIAGPGSYKSLSAVSRIWHWINAGLGSCVVFDPSLEIGPIMSDALRDRGCKVVTIGLDGDGFNVLDWIDLTHPESDAHIRSVTDWIYNGGGTVGGERAAGRADPFWSTWGKSLITCLLAHMLHTAPPGLDRTLTALRRGIAIPENDMQAALTAIHATSRSSMARELAGGLMGMSSPRTFSGIYSEAFSGTEWLSVDAYADVVSGSAMKASAVLNRNTVVFLQLPLRSLLATPAIARAMMGALFNAMFHADTGGGKRILFQLDEAWLLGAMKEIKLCHTTARKYRGTISSIWQSEGQLEEVWGRDGAKLMRDTCSWRSYNAVQDGDVADKLSRDLGEHAVLAYSEGDNRGRQKPWGIALPSSSHGSNVNTHEIKRRLIKADEIMRAPADEMFVLVRDFPQPINAVAAPFFRYSDIARRMRNNRFNTAAE